MDFSQYDNNHDGDMEPIMIIHAGAGAEYTGSKTDIWSHSWYLYNYRPLQWCDDQQIRDHARVLGDVEHDPLDMTIGVFAHEMGAWLLESARPLRHRLFFRGHWQLEPDGRRIMERALVRLGDSPAWPDAWTRIQMGYATPTTLTGDTMGQSIPQVAGSSGTGTVFKLKNAVLASKEYFLVENRQRPAGTYDEYLPGGGLAIWHVDEAKEGNTQECTREPHYLCGSTHYKIALEQADGLRQLEFGNNRGDAGDLFPGSTNNTVWNGSSNPESSSWSSSAATKIGVTGVSAPGVTMTANLLIGVAPKPSVSISDVSVTEGNGGTAGAVFTVSLSDPAPGAVSVRWATANGTASSSTDYVAGSGTLNFAAGDRSKTVTVQVKGDTTVESNETFYVNLTNAVGATISDSRGVGTIVNDDQPARIHVGDLDGTKSTWGTSWMAKVTITVHDAGHRLVSGVAVSGTWGASTGSCTTSSMGVCSISKFVSTSSVTFTVTNLAKTGTIYATGDNHDPDGDSDGTRITMVR